MYIHYTTVAALISAATACITSNDGPETRRETRREPWVVLDTASEAEVWAETVELALYNIWVDPYEPTIIESLLDETLDGPAPETLRSPN